MALNQLIVLIMIGWVGVVFWQWWKKRHPEAPPPSSQELREREVVDAFIADPSSVYALIDFIKKGPAFVRPGKASVYWSPGRRIRAENDIFGYEVNILPYHELVDCAPGAYGLSREQAKLLFEAILTRVPDSSTFSGGRHVDS